MLVFFIFALSLNLTAQNKTDRANFENLVSNLYHEKWQGAEIVGESPTIWDFALTASMKKVLEIGSSSQEVLLENINKPGISAQVIFLLGGVSDEKAIEPIIRAMIPKSKIAKTPGAKIINRSANLALTNLTVADVIWHHGGGIVIERCQMDPKKCWEKWWKKNKADFYSTKITRSRRYSNYPNYGIYKNKM